MIKSMVQKTATALLIPTLLITTLTACGTNNGAKTNTANTKSVAPPNTKNASDGVHYFDYGGYNYDATGFTYNGTNNGIGKTGYESTATNNYNGFGVHSNRLNGYRNYSYGTNNYTTRNSTQQVATRAANTADNVAGVARATAVVQGNDIVIGIDGAANKNQNDLQSLAQKVRSAVQSQEPGYTVHVTTDSKLHSRIQSVYQTLNTNTNTTTPGHPVRDLGADITSILRDMGRTVTAPFTR